MKGSGKRGSIWAGVITTATLSKPGFIKVMVHAGIRAIEVSILLLLTPLPGA